MSSFKSFLLGFSVATFLLGVLFLFLSKTPTFYIPKSNSREFFYINLTHLFFKTNHKTFSNITPLKGIELKGLYFDGKNGFVILYNKKTIFLDLGKSYKGYKLIKIGNNFAIFKKNSKEYKLTLKTVKLKKNSGIEINEDVQISKETFREYKNNLSKIWQNIGIIRVKDGYKINYINKNSIFYKIGLRRGDVLLEVNGKKLTSDADAWELYKNADKFDVFEVKLKRNNKIKVIDYEIN